MKKAIIFLMFVMGCFICILPFSVQATNSISENITDSQSFFCDTNIITQKDFNESFVNYAMSEATVSYLADAELLLNEETSNVVGVVKDYDTEDLISGAMIAVNGENIVKTGEDGRFQIKNFPSGIYNWKISASNYCDAEYMNYDVDYADGTTIFTFYINSNSPILQDRKEIMKEQKHNQVVVSANAIDRGNYLTFSNSNVMTSYPNVDAKVYVLYNGEVKEVDRQTYIYTVVSAELYGVSYYTNMGLTAAQVQELYIAQAMAANTYVEYAKKVYSGHTGYDVCSTHCQRFDPTKVTQAAMTATANIFYTAGGQRRTNIVMYKTTSASYEYVWGAFFSSCGNQGTLTHISQPALQQVNCSDIAAGYGGHRYGMCQMGAAKLAKDGYTAGNILNYYYTNCCIASCPIE